MLAERVIVPVWHGDTLTVNILMKYNTNIYQTV